MLPFTLCEILNSYVKIFNWPLGSVIFYLQWINLFNGKDLEIITKLISTECMRWSKNHLHQTYLPSLISSKKIWEQVFWIGIFITLGYPICRITLVFCKECDCLIKDKQCNLLNYSSDLKPVISRRRLSLILIGFALHLSVTLAFNLENNIKVPLTFLNKQPEHPPIHSYPHHICLYSNKN